MPPYGKGGVLSQQQQGEVLSFLFVSLEMSELLHRGYHEGWLYAVRAEPATDLEEGQEQQGDHHGMTQDDELLVHQVGPRRASALIVQDHVHGNQVPVHGLQATDPNTQQGPQRLRRPVPRWRARSPLRQDVCDCSERQLRGMRGGAL